MIWGKTLGSPTISRSQIDKGFSFRKGAPVSKIAPKEFGRQ